MLTIQIEHAITNFETWKAAFDADPIDRKGSGVRAYRVLRPLDDEHRIIVELDVDDREAAEGFTTKLRSLWRSPQAAPALDDAAPALRLLDAVEDVAL